MILDLLRSKYLSGAAVQLNWIELGRPPYIHPRHNMHKRGGAGGFPNSIKLNCTASTAADALRRPNQQTDFRWYVLRTKFLHLWVASFRSTVRVLSGNSNFSAKVRKKFWGYRPDHCPKIFHWLVGWNLFSTWIIWEPSSKRPQNLRLAPEILPAGFEEGSQSQFNSIHAHALKSWKNNINA